MLANCHKMMELNLIVNVGKLDSVIRFALGMALISFAWFYSRVPLSSLGWLGVLPLATAIFRTSPLYSLLGISTCAASEDEA